MTPLTTTLLFGAAILLAVLAYLPSIPAVRIAVAPRRSAFNQRFANRLKTAGIYDQAPSFIVGGVAALSLLAALVGFALAGHWVGILAGLLFAPAVCYLLLVRRERTFTRRATKELIPFFNRFEAAVRAKVPAPVAYQQAVENANVLRIILGDSAAKVAAGGEFVPCLIETLDRFPLRIWRIFVRQLETHEETGGDLATALGVTVTELNEMISLTAEAAADTASDRFQQVLITLIVVGGVFGFSMVLGREMMSKLWTTPFGIIGGLAGLLVMAGGFWYTLRIMRLIERRTVGEQ